MSDRSDIVQSVVLPVPTRNVGAIVAWACFLGCSWTWVLGMLWPVLLVSEFGVWGWVMFALPNVVGAAAMGFVIARPAASAALIERHRQACFRFSEITIAFHVFVVGWAFWFLLGPWGLLGAAAAAVVGVMVAGRRFPVLVMTGAVTLVSLGCLIAWLTLGGGAGGTGGTGGTGGAGTLANLSRPRRTATDLLLLAPNVVVGFVLCPYLDLTFHRARQALTPTAGRWAFALGFGVVFFTMIVFTLLYAAALRPLFEQPATLGSALPPGLVVVLGLHLTLQAGVTVALHLYELASRRGHEGLHRVGMLAIAGGALAFWAVSEPHLRDGRATGELVYRGFLLFYGLIFPAYVWLCMIPTLARGVAPQAQLAVYGVTLLVTLPMAYLGFIAGESWWLLLALIVLVLARAVVERLPNGEGDRKKASREDER